MEAEGERWSMAMGGWSSDTVEGGGSSDIVKGVVSEITLLEGSNGALITVEAELVSSDKV